MNASNSAGGDPARAELDRRLDDAFREQSKILRVTNSPLVQASLGLSNYTGSIGSLLSANAQKRQEIRYRNFLIEFANYVDNRWDSLKDYIDEEFIASEEFVTVMTDGLEEAGRTADEAKLRFLRSYIINSARLDRPDIRWRDVFRTYLGQLSGTHLVCLQYVFDNQESVSEAERLGRVRSENVPIPVTSFVSDNSAVEEKLARLCFGDLANYGLLVDWRSLGNAEGKFQQEYCITRSGLHFMWFMEGKWRMLEI